MTMTRIYAVKYDGSEVLIEASSQAQAINHAVKDLFSYRIPTTLEVAAIMRAGGEVQTPNNSNKGE